MKRRQLKTKGFILGSKTIGEKDRYVFIYTKDLGKFKAVALGAMNPASKFTGLLETITMCNFDMYQGPKSTIITEVKPEKIYKKIRTDFKKISSAILIAKIINDLTLEHENIPKLFDLIDESLTEIEKQNDESKILLISLSFVLKFLDLTGLLPDFKHHSFEQNEYHSKNIDHKYIKLLSFLREKPVSATGQIKLKENEEILIRDIIKDIVENETSRELKLPI